MTKDEALKLALEALENIDRWLPTIGQKGLREYEADAITAIKKALAQPEQEPVAWIWEKEDGYTSIETHSLDDEDMKNVGIKSIKPLYTTPPQRTWVGLTDEEIMAIAFNFDVPSLVIRTVETKLKEKNNG